MEGTMAWGDSTTRISWPTSWVVPRVLPDPLLPFALELTCTVFPHVANTRIKLLSLLTYTPVQHLRSIYAAPMQQCNTCAVSLEVGPTDRLVRGLFKRRLRA
jgi:hypothetical protein